MYSRLFLAITLCWISTVALSFRPPGNTIRTHRAGHLYHGTEEHHVQHQDTKTNNINHDQSDMDDLQSTSTSTSTSSSSKNKAKTSVLKFGGKYSYASRSIPILLPQLDHIIFLNNFFTNVTNQNVLLTGGNNQSSVESIPLSSSDSELYRIWKTNAMELGAHVPPPPPPPPPSSQQTDIDVDSGEEEENQNHNIRAVKVTPPGIRIWTVEILPETIVGVHHHQTKEPTTTTTTTTPPLHIVGATPEIQAVLIQDSPKAKGPRPLVWLFDRIVHGTSSHNNNNNNNNNSNHDDDDTDSSSLSFQETERKGKKTNEKALLRVWTEEQKIVLPGSSSSSSSSSSQLVFRAESEMFLEFEFPQILLKFFPINQQKAEEICSSAIVKALSMNLIPALDRFADLYLSAMMEESLTRNKDT